MFILKIILSLILIFPSNLNINNDLNNLNLSSENYLLYAVEADSVLASKGSDKRLSIGSVNKILTTITILDYLNNEGLDTEIVVEQAVLNHVSPIASIANLYPNQKISIKELLYGVMMPSGADSITVLAFHLFDGPEQLAKLMNEKAQTLNLKNTSIVNPFGLDAYNQYTTLEDVLTILKYALKNPIFYELYTTKEYKLKNDDVLYTNQILKSAEILGFNNFVGAKSGYTLEAKRALASIAEIDNQKYIFISNRADGGYYLDHGAMLDAIKVYEYIETYYQTTTITNNDTLKTITIKDKEYELETKKQNDINALVTMKFDDSEIRNIDEYSKDLKLPIMEGDIIGTNYLYYQDQLIAKNDIISLETIKKNQYLLYVLVALILLIILKMLRKFFAKIVRN